MTAGEENQSGLVPAQSTALARVGAKSLAARGHTELRKREEAEEWLRKGLEFQQAAPDDPHGRASVNPYATVSPVINKTTGAVPPPIRLYSLRQLQAAAEYIEQLLTGNDPQAAAKSLGMTPDDLEMAHVAHFFMPKVLMEIAGKSRAAIEQKAGRICAGSAQPIPPAVSSPVGMDDGVLTQATMAKVGQLFRTFQQIQEQEQKEQEQLRKRDETLKEAFRCFERARA
jgi:hypothetical protein